MRDFAKFAPTFWTGETGRLLRKDRDAQVVAAYLFTGPMANMIGLYHLPIALISDNTGIPFKGASKALQRVIQTGFCSFDGVNECVFVHEMAARQIGEPLNPKDKQVVAIIRMWQSMRKSPFYIDFHTRYHASFHLPEPSPFGGPSEGLRRGILLETETETETEKEIEMETEKKKARSPGPPAMPFESPAFRDAWALWESHRREKKKPLTPTSTKQQLTELAQMGEERAIQAIRHSVARGYQGIFEPNSGATNGQNTRRTGNLRYDPKLHGEVTPVAPGSGGDGPQGEGTGGG